MQLAIILGIVFIVLVGGVFCWLQSRKEKS